MVDNITNHVMDLILKILIAVTFEKLSEKNYIFGYIFLLILLILLSILKYNNNISNSNMYIIDNILYYIWSLFKKHISKMNKKN